MACTDLREARWYFDESVLGPAKILDRRRNDVVYPGHDLVPALPRGVADTDWIPVVAEMGWVTFCRDRRIRTRPGERTIAREAGLHMVWFAGKQDQRPHQYADMFQQHLPRLERLIIKLGQEPWALSLTSSGFRELTI
jgi:hypothetical protein